MIGGDVAFRSPIQLIGPRSKMDAAAGGHIGGPPNCRIADRHGIDHGSAHEHGSGQRTAEQ